MIDVRELAKLYPDFTFVEMDDFELGKKVITGRHGLYEFTILNDKKDTLKNTGKKIRQRVKDVREMAKQ